MQETVEFSPLSNFKNYIYSLISVALSLPPPAPPPCLFGICHGQSFEVKGQLESTGSYRLPSSLQELNSGNQALATGSLTHWAVSLALIPLSLRGPESNKHLGLRNQKVGVQGQAFLSNTVKVKHSKEWAWLCYNKSIHASELQIWPVQGVVCWTSNAEPEAWA